MSRVLTLVFCAALAATAVAGEGVAAAVEAAAFSAITGSQADLDALRHLNRPIVVFADSPDDPAFTEQMRLIAERWPELAVRDVVVITDTDPAAASAIREKLRPRGFMVVLIDKDGMVALRKPFPWDTRELMRMIDRMPDRREEIRNTRAVTP
jgi:hypothetical protein